tara:strand:+ start:116 stop:1306 length:1191 start_codon:yes stop_codon:yes gene_type:complete
MIKNKEFAFNVNYNRSPMRTKPKTKLSTKKQNINSIEIDWIIGWISPSIFKHESSQDFRRYRDNHELIYSLRSIHMYAPWIRKIHVILGNYSEPPDWIKAHPKINIVNEHDLYTPVQPNSETKKLFYHKIPNLASYFITSDDDMFLLKPLIKKKLFHKKLPILHTVGFGCYSKIKDGNGHIPLFWNKDSYGRAIKNLYRPLYLTMGAFRYNPWIKVKQYLLQHKLCYNGVIRKPLVWINNNTVNIMSECLTNLVKNCLFNQLDHNPYLCINDDFSYDMNIYKNQVNIMHTILSSLYPTEAPWEIDDILTFKNILPLRMQRYQIYVSPCNNSLKKVPLNRYLLKNKITVEAASSEYMSLFNFTIKDDELIIEKKTNKQTGWDVGFNIIITIKNKIDN